MVLDNLLGLAAEAESDAEAYEVAAREAVPQALMVRRSRTHGCGGVRRIGLD